MIQISQKAKYKKMAQIQRSARQLGHDPVSALNATIQLLKQGGLWDVVTSTHEVVAWMRSNAPADITHWPEPDDMLRQNAETRDACDARHRAELRAALGKIVQASRESAASLANLGISMQRAADAIPNLVRFHANHPRFHLDHRLSYPGACSTCEYWSGSRYLACPVHPISYPGECGDYVRKNIIPFVPDEAGIREA